MRRIGAAALVPLAVVVTLTASTALIGCDRPSAGAAGANGGASSVNQGATVRGIEAAQATAQTEYGLLAGGDYAGAWALWTAGAKQAVPRAALIAAEAACPDPLGVPTRVTRVEPVDAAGVDHTGSVDVTWQRGAVTGTDRVVYEGGAWRYEPAPATLDRYRLATTACPTSS